MRNLKKILSLVLAMMMVLSLMATASATSFKDDADITYKEAVEVMSGMGVIAGVKNADGTYSFLPKETLNREAAAKIVAYIKLGGDVDKNTADALINPFSDVNGWSTNVIKYCYSEGVIAGIGGGKFDPKSALDGYAFGKMLLEAAGIDWTVSTATGWRAQVIATLKANNLMTGLETLVMSAPMSREAACQMAWNAMNYSVTGSTAVYQVKTSAGVLLYQGTDALTALIMKQSAEGNVLSLVTTNTGSLANTVFGLTNTTITDAFGRKSVQYTNGKVGTAKVVYATFLPTAVATYTTAITEGKLAASLGAVLTTDKVKVTVITDGVAAAAKDIQKIDAGIIGGAGKTVQVYAKADGSFDVVVVTTKLATLDGSTNKVVAAKAATATTDAVPAYITIGDKIFVTDAFKKGDVILYTEATDSKSVTTIQSAVKATAVVGNIAKYVTDATITVGAATYNWVSGFSVPSNPFTTEYVYYVDGNNNVYGYANTDAITTTADGFVYLLGYQVSLTGNAGNLFDPATATSAAVKAKVVTTAGLTQVIDIDVYTKTEGGAVHYYYVDPVTGTEAEITESAAYTTTGCNKWIAYTVDGGEYTYAALTTGNAAELTLNAAYVKGTATIDMTTGTDPYMTGNTAYTYINTADNKVSTVTGYKNIAIANSTKVLVVYADTAKTIVGSIYYLNAVADSTTTTANYAYAAAKGAIVAAGNEWTFYVGGKAVTMAVKLAKDDTYTATELSANKVYDLRIDAKGIVTGAKEITMTATAQKVALVTDGYVVAGSSAYNFATNYVVYNVTTGTAGTVDTIEVDDYISVLVVDEKVVLVYIVDAPAG